MTKEIKNPSAPATPRQRQAIWKWVRDNRIFQMPLTMGEASELLEASASGDLEKVRRYFPGYKNGSKPARLPMPEAKDDQEKETGAGAESTGVNQEELLSLLSKVLAPEVFGQLTALFEAMGGKENNGYVPPPQSQDYIRPECWDTVSRLIQGRVNTLLFGPAGTGKSRLIKEIAASLDKEFFTLSLSGGVRYSQVFGATAITNGDTHWELSPFLQAVQKPGVVLLDEIFSAEPDILLGLNSLLEPSSREIMTPAGRIAVHAECCFVAAANTNGRGNSRQYTGAGRADDSTLSRFSAKVKVNVDPLVESNLIAHSSLERKDKTWVKEKITSLRQALTLHNIPFDLGTRELISLLNIMATGIDREIALDLAILNSLSVTERKTLGDFGRL